MKKYFILLIELLMVLCPLVHVSGQKNIPQTIELDNAHTSDNYEYIASKSITLKPGFSFKAINSNNFSASIDLLNLNPNPYSTYVSGGSNNGIMGKISDNFDVSSTGAVVYEIPVTVPVGTGGMTPQLSIAYNSTAGDGILGQGFYLGGLSIINRAPSNLYLDGKAGLVNFSSSDKFMLDGNRLIQVASSGTTIEYRTENNTFSKVLSLGGTLGNPQKFIAYTKSGLIYEYGLSSDIFFPEGYLKCNTVPDPDVSLKSTSSSSSNVLFWLLVRVTDSKGNYYKISYGSDEANGEYWPDRIDYTGNNQVYPNLSPYCSVRFSYSTRSSTISYVGGVKVSISHKMTSINLYYGETKIKSYNLNYEGSDVPLLNSVTETSSDGLSYNPTKFTWHKVSSNATKQLIYDQITLLNKADFYIGDFNGDGRMDFIATPKPGANFSGWRLYLNKGSYFSFSGSGDLMDGFKKIYVGDFNGDGKADIIQCRNASGNYYNYFLYTSTGTGFNYTGPAAYTANTPNHGALVGDFNGDGASDLFIYYYNSKECKIIYSVSSNTGSMSPLNYTATRYSTHNWERAEIVDFNGDGLSDVMNLYTDGYDLLESDGYGTMSVTKNGTWPQKDHHLYFGDFNGDGKTDMLLTGWKDYEWAEFQVHLSTGATFERYFIPHYFNSKDKTIFVADINGDGKDDFYAIDKKSPTNGNMTSIYSYINSNNGKSFSSEKGANCYGLDKWNFQIADYNGDGRADCLCSSATSSWSGYQLYAPDTELNNLLKSITDGIGNVTNISYKSMTDNSVHTKGNTSSYPVTSFSSSWKLVDKVTCSNGMGGVFSTIYSYKNALIHKRGKGVLGFEGFTVKEVEKNIETANTYEVNSAQYVIGMKSTEIKCNNKLVSKTDYSNKLKTYQNAYIFTYDVVASIEKKYDLQTSAEYSNISNSFKFDDYGNVVRNVIKYGTNDSIINTNIYDNIIDKWYLGRLKEAQVTKIKNNKSIVRTSKFEYDSNSGLLTKENIEPSNQLLGYTRQYIHDEFGNIKESVITDKSGNVRRQKSEYDTKGRFETKSFDGLNNMVSREVDMLRGLVLSETDPNGLTVSYNYDSFGNQAFTQTPVSRSLKVFRWVKSHSDAPANAVYFSYSENTGMPPVIEFFDVLGRTLRRKTIGFNGQTVYVDIEYNAKGQISKTSEPYFAGQGIYWNKNEYDALGRTTKQIYPDNSFSEISYNALKTTIKNPLGQSDTKIMDVKNNLVESIDNNGVSVNYEYDVQDNCAKVTGPRTVVVAEFDIMGNRTKLIDPDMGTIRYRYNAFGELISQRNIAQADSVTFLYDALGRIQNRTEKEGVTTYLYDTKWKGALSSVQYGNMSETYDYDGYGRLIKTTKTIIDKTYTTQTGYDEFSRISNITYPSGFRIKHEYNEYGFLSEVKNAETGKPYWKSTVVNARGQLEQFVLGNGLTSTREYDPAKGHLLSIKTPGIQDWSYTFNKVGNLTNRTDNRRNLSEKFEYDALNRLAKTYHNNVLKQETTYDAAGNLTYKTGVGTNFEYYDGTNKLKNVSGAGYSPPNWDLIEYTSFNKISTVIKGNDQLFLDYGADHQRNRMKTVRSGVVQMIYYVGKLYEEEYLSTGEIKKKHYIFVEGGSIAVYETSNMAGNKLCYLHKDHLGSLQAISNESGQLGQELSYDAWGRRRNPDNWAYYVNISDANAWYSRGFTGHEHLDVFEMVNMDGRMYDPVLGRFLSPDPFVQAPDYTQGLNRYSYCMNNPLSLVDPSGYSWFSKNWKSLLAATIGIAASVITLGGSTALSAVVIAGAVGGASAGLAGSLLNGANIGQVIKSTLLGGIQGAAGSFLAFGSASPNLLESLFKHSFSQAWLAGISGGNMKHGFMAGFASALGGAAIGRYAANASVAVKVAANAVVGGTVAELGGGKFANGAVTGAFVMLFNHLAHEQESKKIATLQDMMAKLLQEEKGTILTAEQIKQKYKIKQNIGFVIKKVEVLGDGNFNVVFRNNFLINNSPSYVKINDGNMNVSPLNINGMDGFSIEGNALSLKIGNDIYRNLFLNDNYIYGVKNGNKLTDGYGF